MPKPEFTYDSETMKILEQFVAKDCSVKIGVLSDKPHTGSKFGMAKLAATHEFGSEKRNIPKRSFMIRTMVERRQDFESFVKLQLGKFKTTIVSAGGPKKVLGQIGAKWVAYILETFERQGPGWKSLKPATAKRKNSDIILTDTGALKRAITFKVEA